MLQLLKERFRALNPPTTLIETIVLSLAYVFLLFLFGDSMKLDAHQDIGLLFLALITLFGGTFSGVVALMVISLGIYFFSFAFALKTLLKYLVFVLLFGEFHFHWKRKNRQNEEEKFYLKEKFRELSNAFFALKVSHDQLEKGYLLKPVTLRSMIIDLSKLPDEKRNMITLFETFEEAFSLTAATYCKLDSDYRLIDQVSLGKGTFVYDINHAMVDHAISEKKAVFLSQSKVEQMENEPVLAVLPVLNLSEEIIAVFVIEKMDFLAFNMDNILKMQILLEYFEHEMFQNKDLLEYQKRAFSGDMDAKFYFEITRLGKMRQRYGIHSAMVIVRTSDKAIALLMENFRMKKMRLLDMIDVIHSGDDTFYLFLLPLEHVSGAISFKGRLESQLNAFSSASYHIVVSEVEHIDQVQAWLQKSEV